MRFDNDDNASENEIIDENEDEFEPSDEDTVLTIASSEIARLLSNTTPEGDEARATFGSQFEKAYQELCYHRYKFNEQDADVLLDELETNFYGSSFQQEARKIAEAFLNQDIHGLTPKTQFRALSASSYVAAKPDLYDSDSGRYYEFKIYPLCEYSRNQARVFSWVVQAPIYLVGYNQGNVEIERITAEGLVFPRLPRSSFTETPRERIDQDRGSFHPHHGHRFFYIDDDPDYFDGDDEFDGDFTADDDFW
jgi:hypothetical protein